MDLQHTEVPEAYRGREIAKHLAKVVEGYSRSVGTGLHMMILCYVVCWCALDNVVCDCFC